MTNPDSKMSRFTDRVVIVTGSTRGIGLAVAKKFHDEGAKVVISSSTQKAIDNVLGQLNGSAIGIKANIAKSEEVANLISETKKRLGRVDIVVNNAGITRDNLLMRMKEEEWDTVLDINLKGAFLVIKAASRIMIKQRYGRIINISSVIGLGGNAGQANYSASKAGMIGLTKSAAKELASRNITVNAVAPGFIETDMTKDMPEAARESFLEKVSLGRYGSPEDVAGTVLFLASEEASYITGQVIAVDGGLTM